MPLDKLGVHIEELEWRRFFGNVSKIVEGCVSYATNNVAEKSTLSICVKAASDQIFLLSSSEFIFQ